MLVLSRRKNEELLIGADVRVLFTEVKERRVQVGIVAPAHVLIYRKERYERMLAEGVAPDLAPVAAAAGCECGRLRRDLDDVVDDREALFKAFRKLSAVALAPRDSRGADLMEDARETVRRIEARVERGGP